MFKKIILLKKLLSVNTAEGFALIRWKTLSFILMRINVFVRVTYDSVQVSPHLNGSYLIHLRHFIQGLNEDCCCMTGMGIPSVCVCVFMFCVCMSYCRHLSVVAWKHAYLCACVCVCVRVCLPQLSASVSVSLTTVFPVFSFIKIPSSFECNSKSNNLWPNQRSKPKILHVFSKRTRNWSAYAQMKNITLDETFTIP